MVRRSRGDLAGAGSDLDLLLRENPAYPEAWIERGHVSLAAGNKESALRAGRDYEKGIALDPTLDLPALREARTRARAAAGQSP